MRILFDTSALIAGIVKTHPAHSRVLPWLQQVKAGTHHGLVAVHSLAEFYATLTGMPAPGRVSPVIARQLIQQEIMALMELVALSTDDYHVTLERALDLEIVGGAIYDALIMQAASKANADTILTLNAKHFRRVYPELAHKIIAP